MYESFFQFHDRPFAAAPSVNSFFPAEGIEHARQTLIRLVERAEGPGIVVGAAGLGKSLLCRMLGEYFRHRFDIVTISSTQIRSRKALLQNILFEVGLPYRDLEEGELRLSLIDFLRPGNSSENGMLLLVDEAHLLSLRLLEEIRLITNLVRDGQMRVHLVLAGGSKLEERFAHPKLDSFNQRLAARCYLDALCYEETARYVHTQISRVGADPDEVMGHDAWQAIHRASGGVPRLINQICDHALVLACAAGQRQLTAGSIEEAWSDLQQLPGPWQESTSAPLNDASEGESIIEISSWDEETSTTETATEFEPSSDGLPVAEFESDHEGAIDEIPIDEIAVDEIAVDEADTDEAQVVDTKSIVETSLGEDIEAYTDITGSIACEYIDWELPEERSCDDELVMAAEFEDTFVATNEAPDEPLVGVSQLHEISIDDIVLEVDETFEEAIVDETLIHVIDIADDQERSIGPSHVTDPFGEFVEEEIVIDQLTARALEAFQGRPLVQTALGNEIARALKSAADQSQDDEGVPTVGSAEAEETKQPVVATEDDSEEAPRSEGAELDWVSEVVEYNIFENAASADVELIGIMPDLDALTLADDAPSDLHSAVNAADLTAGDAAILESFGIAEEEVESEDCVAIPITRGLSGDDRDLIEVEDEAQYAPVDQPAGLDARKSSENSQFRALFAQLRKA